MRRALLISLALLLSLQAPAGAQTASTSKKPAAKPKASGPEPPKEREYSYIWDMVHHSLARPIARTIDPARLIRKVSGNTRQAANVDPNDQVRLPSTWWQPRLGFREVTIDQMLRGPGPGKGPAPGRLTVKEAKSQGVTPGFQIEDSAGDKFLFKFDPPDFPELASGADVIGSYLFWAAGYNVPDNTLAIFRAEDLDIDPEATIKDAIGNEKPFTKEHLHELLLKVARRRDGSFRALASKFLKGKPLGPFEYHGRRKDDPEDLVPHELRRELRGLWTLAAWVNHADIRGPNSLDMWVEDGGRSFVRHHLIDFGSILGSSAIGSRSPVTGTEYYVDFNVIGASFLTLGLLPFAWEDAVDPRIPAVGMIESKVFDPVQWRPDYPNPAFDDRTERDIRWGARIVAGFTDDHIRAAVQKAQFTDPAATEYMTRVLIERRDKIVRAWRPATTTTSSSAMP